MSDKKNIKLQFNKDEKPEEFYLRFKETLEESHDFPENYIFKFIIENEPSKLTEIYKVFDGLKHTFSTKESSKAKYLSCTIDAFVLDADQVIKLYKETAKIDGVVML